MHCSSSVCNSFCISAAGWMDDSLLLGVFWPIFCLPSILPVPPCALPWHQVCCVLQDRISMLHVLLKLLKKSSYVWCTGHQATSTKYRRGHCCTGNSTMPKESSRPSLSTGLCLAACHTTTRVSLPCDLCTSITAVCVDDRYSKGCMPIANLFRNCSYYWVFAAFVSYFINHPLYTPPLATRSAIALSLALVCQLCNLRQVSACVVGNAV